MRTTVNISDATLTALRQRAAQRGRSLNAELEEVLQTGLAASSTPRRRPVRLKTHPVGIKAAFRGVSMNQLFDQLEADRHVERR